MRFGICFERNRKYTLSSIGMSTQKGQINQLLENLFMTFRLLMTRFQQLLLAPENYEFPIFQILSFY